MLNTKKEFKVYVYNDEGLADVNEFKGQVISISDTSINKNIIMDVCGTLLLTCGYLIIKKLEIVN